VTRKPPGLTFKGFSAVSNDEVLVDLMEHAIAGDCLSSHSAAVLEERLEKGAGDDRARAQLLGYWFPRRQGSESARSSHDAQVLWLIEHTPDSPILALPQAYIVAPVEDTEYERMRTAWLRQVQVHGSDPAVLGNAARFFILHDPELSESLLKKARTLDPLEHEWAQLLGQVYTLRYQSSWTPEERHEAAALALDALEESLRLADEEVERSDLLDEAAKIALAAGSYEKAAVYARELLTYALSEDCWEKGNAVHDGNMVLGCVALRAGQTAIAKAHLMAAGRAEGSSHLNSFGPNMTLAKELLEAGERAAVLKYLRLCRRFWPDEILGLWIEQIERGAIPEFGPHLYF
jgi:tetratricopeptide (TPR) repeat protein